MSKKGESTQSGDQDFPPTTDRGDLSGPVRYKLHIRLGSNWRDLATVLNIPSHEQNRFPKGDEGYAILDWLENQNRLDELPEALETIGQSKLCGYIAGLAGADTGSPGFKSARQAYLSQLQKRFLQQAHLYAPLAGDAAVQPRRKKRLASAAPSPLFKHFPDRLAEDFRQAAPENREYSDIILAFDELQRAVLIGEPGAGKTTALYKLAQLLSEQAENDSDAPVPVLIPLREWLEPDQDLLTFMAGQMGELGAHPDELLQQNKLILLLDGLNEIQTTQQKAKAAQIGNLLRESAVRLFVSCREQDYRDDLKLNKLDTLAIRPLSPSRILSFIQGYLIDAHDGDEQAGKDDADTLFWRLAGGEDVRETWETWREAGAPDLDYFWSAGEIPRRNPDVYAKTSGEQDRIWHSKVNDPRSLIKLAANPFLLWMITNLYWELGHIPVNRAELLGTFIRALLAREGLASKKDFAPTKEGRQLLEMLTQHAWAIQMGFHFLMPKLLPYLRKAASTSLIERGTRFYFTHQLLQEYFVALRLQELFESNTLNGAELWSPERWWERSGWEEATVLLAGLYKEDCTRIVEWLRDTQPEVAAQCINNSGACVSGETLLSLREVWLRRLTDIRNEPDPRARAAIGRALGSLSVDGVPLDNRKGVWGAYFTETQQAVVDIDWVEIPNGRFIYQDSKKKRKLDTFYLSRYPVTHSQFQVFIDDPAGYARKDWWDHIPHLPHAKPAFWQFHNHPRETVSWFEAIAFCRWLSALLGYPVTLPTEEQWERAARGNKGKRYPWGDEYQSGYANINETIDDPNGYFLQQPCAVGLYPQGASTEGVMDMVGNVWEWCLNHYDKPSITTIEDTGAARVLRGVSWGDYRVPARTVYRHNAPPGSRSDSIGFRLCSSSPII